MAPDRGAPTGVGSEPTFQAGHHWVSPFNADPSTREGFDFPRPLTVFDSTLRKIMYCGGLRPTIDDMLRVAEALETVGIGEVFFNVDWWGDAQPEQLEYEVCRALLARGFGFRTTVYSDAFVSSSVYGANSPVASRQAVDTLRAIGMTMMQVPLGDPGDAEARGRQAEQLAEVVSYAQSLGIVCALGLLDAGRTDFEFLVQRANLAIDLGVARLDLSDSYSSLSPEAMKVFIRRFRSRLTKSLPLTLHVHDDFGLGTATAIAAATAGAHPDVAVNGISYRSGFAALEEVAVSLEVLYGVRTGLRLDYLQRLSEIVAAHSGLPVPPLKPITGAQAFLRDLPAWVVPYLEGGADAFPPPASCVAPSVVGARMRAVWGNHHSSFVLRTKLRQLGLEATEEQVAEIRRRVEAAVRARASYPRWLTEDEVEQICRAVVGARTSVQGDGRDTLAP